MQEFERIISSLPANTQTILRQLAAGGAALSARELLGILTRLIWGLSETQLGSLWSALIWLANAGRIKLATLVGASELLAAGEGASVVAEGAAAAGAAETGAVAVLATTVAAFIFALLSLLLAYHTISTELKTKPIPAPAGLPCTGTGPKGTTFTLSRSAIGSRTSYNKAVAAATAHAGRVMTCSGTGCAHGKTCSAVAIPISVVPAYRVFWTTTTITYRVGCACV